MNVGLVHQVLYDSSFILWFWNSSYDSRLQFNFKVHSFSCTSLYVRSPHLHSILSRNFKNPKTPFEHQNTQTHHASPSIKFNLIIIFDKLYSRIRSNSSQKITPNVPRTVNNTIRIQSVGNMHEVWCEVGFDKIGMFFERMIGKEMDGVVSGNTIERRTIEGCLVGLCVKGMLARKGVWGRGFRGVWVRHDC